MKFYVGLFAFIFSFQVFASGNIKFLPTSVMWQTKRAGLCSGNGTNKIGSYDPKSFDYAKAIEFIRKQDAEVNADSKDCSQNRVYSSDTDGAVAKFENLLDLKIAEPMEDYNEANQVCFEDERLSWDIPKFKEFAKSFDNLSVISSSFLVQDDDFEHGERCSYWDFYFFRKDGFVVKWSFDHSL